MKRICLTFMLVIGMSFAVNAHVNLLNPSGGEQYNPGDTVTILWQIAISHNLQNWDLFFSDDGGITYDTLQIDIPSTGNSVGTQVTYEWIVPNNPTTTARIWIYMDNSGTDYDDTSPNFTINSTLGISSNEASAINNLYPNPLSKEQFLTLELQGNDVQVQQVQIIDASGKIVKTQPVNSLTNNMLIEVSGLKDGLYHVVLFDKKGALIDRKKIIVSKR